MALFALYLVALIVVYWVALFDCISHAGVSYDEEAIRVVKMMPKWIPARLYGYSIQTLYQIPIRFRISEN